MLSNLESQLKEQGASDKIDDVLKEIAVVQKDSGFPPLVTPTSQIVGTQAVFNVLFGRYNKLSGEFQDLVAGKYGACPAPKNPDVVKKALEALKMANEITHRPADDIPAEYSKLEEETKKLLGTSSVTTEDVLTYAMFPKVAPDFFKKRADGPVVFKPEAEGAAPAARGQAARYSVNVNGANYDVVVAPAGTVAVSPASAPAAAATTAAPAVSSGPGTVIVPAPVAGVILRYAVSEGAEVKSGQTIIILESMKMELEIKSNASGKVHFITPTGTQVLGKQPVAEISGENVPISAPAEAAPAAPASAATAATASGSGTVVIAPVAGILLRYAVSEGETVSAGKTIAIIESMKMELEIKANASGIVHFIAALSTQLLAKQPIAEIS
jgi:oxaloacetate decarboxylase alpha subunit